MDIIIDTYKDNPNQTYIPFVYKDIFLGFSEKFPFGVKIRNVNIFLIIKLDRKKWFRIFEDREK